MSLERTELVVGQGRITLVQADITTLPADAIVNAANQHLAGGGGVDGAIHRAGGPAIMAELRSRYQGCPTGQAVITGAGNLPCRFVIHAVGPRWRDGRHGENELLRDAYAAALRLAHEHHCSRVALPSISTGIYGFPVVAAAAIALEQGRIALTQAGTALRELVWALFSAEDLRHFAVALSDIKGAA